MYNGGIGFEPKEYICRFGFDLVEYVTDDTQSYRIIGDLYEGEIVFDFFNKRTGETEEAVGFKLSDSDFKELLPLIKWDKYEKYRDLPEGWEWEFKNGHNGYRDGWSYKFWCLSESGYPLFQTDMSTCFNENKLPPYEKLLLWIKNRYGAKGALKNKNMWW